MSQFHRDQASDSNEVVIPLMLDGTYPMITPGLDWTRLFMSLTAGAGTRCMSLLPDSPTLVYFIFLLLLQSCHSLVSSLGLAVTSDEK